MPRVISARLRSQWVAIVLGLTLVGALTVAAPAASDPQASVPTLDLQAGAALVSTSVSCPADVPANTTECRTHTLVGSVTLGAGLGRTWLSATAYTVPLAVGPPACPAGLGKPLATSGRLVVERFAGKGELTFTLAEGARCVGIDAWSEPQELTITGGTGPFAGASGSGAVQRYVERFDDPIWGTGEWAEETWTGTLTAPALHLALPKLTGAVAKTVRAAKGAKRARVTFDVSATDDHGGAIPVSCYPSSGSRFRVGKTSVLCLATDTSGNTASAGFTVTVQRHR